MDLHVIPECYIDTRLVRSLVPPQSKHGYNHQHGCSNVAKYMQTKLKGNFALGVIDKDKQQLFKHSRENHFLIVIRPAMERWILNTAAVSGISLLDFDLPEDLNKLCDITKTAKGDREDPNAPKFARLFKELSRHNPPAIAVLKHWITYLKANPYQVNLTQLIDETEALIC